MEFTEGRREGRTEVHWRRPNHVGQSAGMDGATNAYRLTSVCKYTSSAMNDCSSFLAEGPARPGKVKGRTNLSSRF